MDNITLRSNDNILYNLYITSDIYKYSSLFTELLKINNDEILTIDIPFNSSLINILNKVNDIYNWFTLSETDFIDIYNFLTFILFDNNTDKFIRKFIRYMVKNKINYLEGDYLRNEIQNINNYLNNVNMDIQIQQTSLTFYKTILIKKAHNKLIIKHNRKDIYYYIHMLNEKRNKKYENDNEYNYDNKYNFQHCYCFVNLYNNELTSEIKQTNEYKLYIKYISHKLYHACKNNDTTNITKLLNSGADINYIDGYDNYIPCLNIAVENNCVDVVKVILEYDNTLINLLDLTFTFIISPKYIEMIKLLLYYKVNLKSMENSFEGDLTPLAIACDNGDIELVKIMLDKNASWYNHVIESINEDSSISYEIVTSALGCASKNGYYDIVKILLDNGAQYNYDDVKIAIENNHLDVLKTFINNGVDVNLYDEYGGEYTLIMDAVLNNKINIVKYLLDNGGDIFELNDEAANAIQIAIKNEHLDIIKLFIDNGLHINMQYNCDEYTLLMHAVMYNKIEIVKYLLDNGADVSLFSEDDERAKDIAIKHNYLDIVNLISLYEKI